MVENDEMNWGTFGIVVIALIVIWALMLSTKYFYIGLHVVAPLVLGFIGLMAICAVPYGIMYGIMLIGETVHKIQQ